MKQIYAGRLRKFICVFSVMVLMLGMCFRDMETDSFFAYIQGEQNSATLENISSTIENVDVSCLETIQRQDAQSSRTDMKRSTRRYVMREFLSDSVEAHISVDGEKSIYQECSSLFVKCFNHIAILNFIHSQDGEK